MGSLRGDKVDLSAILRNFEERLQGLETAERAGYTSIGNGGSMQVRDATGTRVVNIGSNPNTGGYGIELSADGSGSSSSFVKVSGFDPPTGFFRWTQVLTVNSNTGPTLTQGSYSVSMPVSTYSYSAGTYTVLHSGVYSIGLTASSDSTSGGRSDIGVNFAGGALVPAIRNVSQRNPAYAGGGSLSQVAPFIGWMPAGATFTPTVFQNTADSSAVSYSFALFAGRIL